MPQDTNSVLNKFSSNLVLLLCAFFLSSCSSTKNVTAFTPPAVNSDQAVVYIYRPNTMANAMYSPGLTIDGEFRLYVKNATSTRLPLAPGKHVFEFQNDKNYSELKPLSLIYKAGSVYFIRVATSLKINNATSYEPYQRSFRLEVIDESLAVKEISKCCMHSNKKPDHDKKHKATGKENSEGFSVDKTQNPFSH